jgi:bud site selection protein 20
MGGQKQRRRKANGARNRVPQANRKMKNGYVKDIDQIVLMDMLEENTQKLNNQPVDEDKPGLGQFYCIPCARYLIH